MYVACTKLRVIQNALRYRRFSRFLRENGDNLIQVIWWRHFPSETTNQCRAENSFISHPGTTCALSANLVRLTCDQSERFCDRKSPNSTTIDIAPLLEIQAPIHNSSLYRIENDWPPSWINWSWVCPQWLMGCGIKIFSRPSENDVTESPE